MIRLEKSMSPGGSTGTLEEETFFDYQEAKIQFLSTRRLYIFNKQFLMKVLNFQ